jgi:hypothetical protein
MFGIDWNGKTFVAAGIDVSWRSREGEEKGKKEVVIRVFIIALTAVSPR